MAAPNTNAQPADSKSASLEGVPDDIHYLLFTEYFDTSPSSIFAMGQSSRALRQAALPYVYRNLVLAKGSSQDLKRPGYKPLLDILQDDKDCQIVKHVRSITVKDEIPETVLAFVINKVSECGTLRKLNWETPTHIPSSILDKIHATWPELKLSVRVLDRWDAPQAHRQMDVKLLSSPLLVNLVYTIYSQAYSADRPDRSEWPKLTQALVSGGNIRALRVLRTDDRPKWEAKTRDSILGDDELLKLARLDLTPETRLPKLEELSITEERSWNGLKYLWDAEHCHILRSAIDCSRLRRLNFGEHSPGAFFSAFKELLPNLKALKFGLVEDSIGDAKTFIESTTALESLVIHYADIDLPALWPAIRKHRSTLKELVLRPSSSDYFRPRYYSSSFLDELKNDFPSLERLGWVVPCRQNIDAEHLATLSTMDLKKLDLFFHLPGGANDYSAELRQDAMGSIAPPPLSQDGTKKAAITIMELISQTQEEPLEWLTLHISRTGYEDRAQPYLMQTNMQLRRRKDKQPDGDQGYEVRGSPEWYGIIPIEIQMALEEE